MLDSMTGHLRKINEGKWFVRISAGKHPISGKRIQKSLVVYGSRKDAERVLYDLRGREYAGSLVSSAVTLNEIFALWLSAPTKGGRKRAVSTTYHDQKRFERYVKPSLGGKKADDIRRVDFENLYQSLIQNAGLSPRSVLHIHSILRASLNWGWRRELVTSRAITKVVPPSAQLFPPRAPDKNVVQGHLDILKESNPDLWIAVFLAATMGMRRNEIAGLRWSNINLGSKTLDICEGIVKIPGHGLITTETKTGLHGHVRFDMHETTFDALVSRYSEFGQRLLSSENKDQSNGYLFSSDLLCERPIDPDLLTKWLRKHCAKHPEIEPITFQSLRKFTSSALEGGGVDETTASALLRDNPETVSRHYRAANASRLRSATLLLGNLLSSQSS